MVMHTWRKLNSYNKTDYISIISNIIEFIEKDIKNNRVTFKTDEEEFAALNYLLELVRGKKKSRYFFGLLNNAELFGFFSRHGSKELVDYKKLSTNELLDVEIIRENMLNQIMPQQNEIKYLFNIWHYTTSLIVTIWFRLKQYKEI